MAHPRVGSCLAHDGAGFSPRASPEDVKSKELTLPSKGQPAVVSPELAAVATATQVGSVSSTRAAVTGVNTPVKPREDPSRHRPRPEAVAEA